MPVYVEGALVGLALGVVLTLFEWYALNKAAKERGERLHRSIEMDETEKRRINTVLRFSLLLPAGFALAWWIIWG
jgi:hypothetical protein